VHARFATLALAAFVSCRSGATSLTEARADEPSGADGGVAVVELFTSEGCSSCPPADDVLANLAESRDRRIYPLAFHVDYWDELGWPDRFAAHAYTARQQAYSQALGLMGAYTPQMIVGGTEEFTGSDRGRADAALARALSHPAKLRLSIQSRSASQDAATVDYTVSEVPAGAVLNVAVVEHRATTLVRSGENAGKTLRHANVVRGFVSVPLTAPTGSVTVHFAASLSRDHAELTGFVQRGALVAGMPVLGAARAPLAGAVIER
jgi:hypothetical protein